MKARIINNYKYTYNEFLNCVSVGDKISEISTLHDKNNKFIGIYISTGHKTKTGIYFDFNAIVPPSRLSDSNTREMIQQKLTYGKYILSTDNVLADFLTNCKSELKSEGIILGDIFTYPPESPQHFLTKT